MGGLTTYKAGDMAADLSSRAVMQSREKTWGEVGTGKIAPNPNVRLRRPRPGGGRGCRRRAGRLKARLYGEGRIDDDAGSSRNE